MTKLMETIIKNKIIEINEEIEELSRYKSTSPYVVRLCNRRIGELVIKLTYLIDPSTEQK